MTEAEEFLSLQEVAERLKVSEQAVRRWIKAGRLKAYQPVREYRIKASDLDAFLEARVAPKAPAPSPPKEEERRAAELEETAEFCAQAGTRLAKRVKNNLNTSDSEALKNELLEIAAAYAWLLGAHQQALSEHQQVSPELLHVFREARNAFESVEAVAEQREHLGTVPEGPREVRPVRAPRAQEPSGTEDAAPGNAGA